MAIAEIKSEDPAGKPLSQCKHCGLDLPTSGGHGFDSTQFCCAGCEFVYSTLNDLGLEKFYALRENTNQPGVKAPRRVKASFAIFDTDDFAQRYTREDTEGVREIRLLLDGVHCAACVWLIEKLPELLPGVVSCQVNFASGELLLKYNFAQAPLSQIASTLASLGYPASPSTPKEKEQRKKREERSFLLRIGVAGLAAGNTMLIAVSLYQGAYTGIPGEYAGFLRWISALIALPAVTYSAYPFIKGAIGGLRAGLVHIDLPISLGVLAGYTASLVNTAINAEEVYFDSVCMLIFLLLCARWFQYRGIRKAAEAAALLPSLLPLSSRLVVEQESSEILTDALSIGDVVRVERNEIIPADGEVINGKGLVDNSILTGEVLPLAVNKGNRLFAGTKIVSGSVDLFIKETGTTTRIGKLMQLVEDASRRKTPLTELTDRLSGYFVTVVITLAAITLGIWSAESWNVAFNHMLAVLIVTCPCALGLGAPLAQSAAIWRAATKGILFRSAAAIEKLTRTTDVFLDKTGTLTSGAMKVTHAWFEGDAESIKKVVLAAEIGIEHPIAAALVNKFAESVSPADVSEQEYIVGRGIVARSGGANWKIGSPDWIGLSDSQGIWKERFTEVVEQSSTPLAVSCNGAVCALIGVGDSIKASAFEFISFLKHNGIQPSMITGDRKEIAEEVAASLKIDRVYAQVTPEEKLAALDDASNHGSVVMIGDGINDAAALQAADVGVGVKGGAEAALSTADVYIDGESLVALKELFLGSGRTVRLIKANLTFSLLYNLTAGLFAMAGYIDPLMAAVLMPISSFIVVLSSTSIRTFR